MIFKRCDLKIWRSCTVCSCSTCIHAGKTQPQAPLLVCHTVVAQLGHGRRIKSHQMSKRLCNDTACSEHCEWFCAAFVERSRCMETRNFDRHPCPACEGAQGWQFSSSSIHASGHKRTLRLLSEDFHSISLVCVSFPTTAFERVVLS